MRALGPSTRPGRFWCPLHRNPRRAFLSLAAERWWWLSPAAWRAARWALTFSRPEISN